MSRFINVRRRQPQSKLQQAVAAVTLGRAVLGNGRARRFGPAGLLAMGAFALLKKRRAAQAESLATPPAPPQSYRTTPTPASGQPSVNGGGGGTSGPDPAGPTATEQAKDEEKSATPPHGDPLLDEAEKAPTPEPSTAPAVDDDAVGGPPNESAITTELAEKESEAADADKG